MLAGLNFTGRAPFIAVADALTLCTALGRLVQSGLERLPGRRPPCDAGARADAAWSQFDRLCFEFLAALEWRRTSSPDDNCFMSPLLGILNIIYKIKI